MVKQNKYFISKIKNRKKAEEEKTSKKGKQINAKHINPQSVSIEFKDFKMYSNGN